MSNPFILDPSEYKRDIDPLNHYKQQQAHYLSKMLGKDYDHCLDFVNRQLGPDGAFPFQDPAIQYTDRGDNGDRELKTMTLHQYITQAVLRHDIIAPTMTTYLNPKRIESYLVSYIDTNVAVRNKSKKEMHAAKRAGDKLLASIKNNVQNNKKISNNSISGGHVSPSTPLYNPTGHSTLTSNCRITSGFGNANNEKFLAGNRHYWSPDIVRNSITAIINRTDYALLSAVMEKYQLYVPTVDDVMACIDRSARQYWESKLQTERIRFYVSKLEPLERAAFVYVGDFYHLTKYNESVSRTFLSKLSARKQDIHPDPLTSIKRQTDSILSLAAQINPEEMAGKKASELPADSAEASMMALTAENIVSTLDEYRDFIKAFWVTENVPGSLAYLPDSIRHVALTSDTDSTIFTVQDWVQWYCGEMVFGQRGGSIAATMIFLAESTIVHILAMMSANLGVEKKRLFQIAMKNEYKFDVFVPTQVAKHYFATKDCQEGNIFLKYDIEKKGVHLKSSNAPAYVNDKAEELMIRILETVKAGKKISINEYLREIGDVERKMIDSIQSGSTDFFRRGQIKPAGSYTKDADQSPYRQYSLWNEVFGPKYGVTPPPPYVCVKLTSNINSPSKTKEWLDSLADQELAGRFRDWMLRYNQKYIGSLQIPQAVVANAGVPKELVDIVGVRKMVADACVSLYIVLESLGVYMSNDRQTRLVSDTH